MLVDELMNELKIEFASGVPDSTLRALEDFIMTSKGISKEHIIAANEGNAVAIAAGYHMSTGKIPLVYLQNSGIGNAINPIASLMNEKIYGIPCIFIVGWRGEPNVKDEPQHLFQGEITLKLLENLDIKYLVIDKNSKSEDVKNFLNQEVEDLNNGKQVALVIKKESLEASNKVKYTNEFSMKREAAIDKILDFTLDNPVLASTGKIGREVFSLRDLRGEPHYRDFLSVGAMGHVSSVALGISLYKLSLRVWCLDGDGAVIMHMGALSVIGANKPNNLVHVLFNNGAHESVGGLPTVSESIDYLQMAKAVGYEKIYSVDCLEELENVLKSVSLENQLTFIEIKVAIGSRADLGRPTISSQESKVNFMKFLSEK